MDIESLEKIEELMETLHSGINARVTHLNRLNIVSKKVDNMQPAKTEEKFEQNKSILLEFSEVIDIMLGDIIEDSTHIVEIMKLFIQGMRSEMKRESE